MPKVPLPFTPGSEIRETFCRIEFPQRKEAVDLVSYWQNRPQDGIEIGRDIPSRDIARHLGNILIWEPISSGNDFRLYLAGEGLRRRFGGNAVGHTFSELLDPETVDFFQSKGRTLLSEDRCICFDILHTRHEPVDGERNLHFELVIFPIWAAGRKARWIMNGVYYFP